MKPIFIVFVFTRLRIQPESTALLTDFPSTDQIGRLFSLNFINLLIFRKNHQQTRRSWVYDFLPERRQS